MVNSDARARPTTQVARLLAAGAEPNATALCAAAFSGHRPGRPGAVKRLSALSVFHSKSVLYGGFVWAHRALKHLKRRFPARAVEVARLLLEAGADPGCADNDGTTPLMDAAGLVTR